MAFPVVESSAQILETTDTTTHDVPMPSGIQSGDLLLILVGTNGNPTVSADPTGFTNFLSAPNSTNCRIIGWYRRATGSETATTFTLSASEQSAGRIFRISGAHTSTNPAIGTAVSTVTANPNPPSLDPSTWGLEDTLWIAAHAGADGSATVSAWPTYYTDNQHYEKTSVGAGGAALGVATQNLRASAEDPSTWTLSASMQAISQTIAIRPATDSTDWPNVSATATGGSSADVTTPHPVNIPSSPAAGDLLISAFVSDGSATVSDWPTGWTALQASELGGTSVHRWEIRYKIADGTETNFNLTTSVAESSAAITYLITNWDETSTPAIGVTSKASTAQPDPPSLNPSTWDVEQTLWLAFAGWDDGRTNVTAAPTGFTDLLVSRPNTAAGGTGVAGATRYKSTASEDPGVFTANAVDPMMAQTVAVRPSGVSAHTGSAALVGSGVLSASGTRIKLGAFALSGTGAVAASGTHIGSGAATLSGSGILSAAGVVVGATVEGAATLSGSGLLAASGTPARAGASALVGSGTLIGGFGSVVLTGATLLTGSGILSAASRAPQEVPAWRVYLIEAEARFTAPLGEVRIFACEAEGRELVVPAEARVAEAREAVAVP